MLLLSQRMRSTLTLVTLALPACAGSPPTGGTETSPTTTASTSTTETTGYVPDQVACDEVKQCISADDCCEGPVYDGGPCPGAYPNNWTCVASECVHGGCTQTSDCVNRLTPGFVCRTINAVGHCVRPCTENDTCQQSMPGTACVGVR